MANKTDRGRAQLREMGPAAGIYEVDYIIHTNVQNIKNEGAEALTRKVSSADIRSVNGYGMKNGIYILEQEGKILCQLKKAGVLWQFMDEAASTGENK
jgi:hypothetical protein